jgi:hypothetical protein
MCNDQIACLAADVFQPLRVAVEDHVWSATTLRDYAALSSLRGDINGLRAAWGHYDIANFEPYLPWIASMGKQLLDFLAALLAKIVIACGIVEQCTRKDRSRDRKKVKTIQMSGILDGPRWN